MVNGLTTSSMSMQHLMKKQDVASHNLANAQSTGFKLSKLVTKTEVVVQPNDEFKLHQDERQILDEVIVDFTQGPLIETQNNFDVAFKTEGFFEIGMGEETVYARKGAFSISEDGILVTLNGHPVLSEAGGEISIQGDKVRIASDGGVYVDGTKVADIAIRSFPNNGQLGLMGTGYYRNLDPENNAPERPDNIQLAQGYLEGSNVNVIDSMVQMIATMRQYEANQKMVNAIDESIGKAVNEVGRVV